MLDIKYIVENTQEIKDMCNAREKNLDIDKLIDTYHKKNQLKVKIDNLRQQKNQLTETINQKKKNKENIENEIKQLKTNKIKIKKIEDEYQKENKGYIDLMYQVPNLLDKRVPLGNEDREEFIVEDFREFDFNAKTNWELLNELNIADFKRGIKVAGNRGWVLKDNGARLTRAITNFILDFWRKKGYLERTPPYFVNEENLYITGHYPNGEKEVYRTEDGKVFVGTAEICLLGLYKDEILNKKDLPIKLMAYTPCFRREAGNHADDKGLYRTHQFDKVELIHITTKEKVIQEYEKIFEDLEELYQKLELPYRMITLRANDMAKKAVIERDMELWFEGENRWGEVGSFGLTGDYQARRGNIKYEGEGRKDFVHTIYATGGVANRILVGILNNNQMQDGKVKVPKVLVDYMGGIKYL